MSQEPNSKTRILASFPKLREDSFEIIEGATDEYNCIAWAAGDKTAWWWPGTPDSHYWPDGIPREETLEAFVQALATLGYSLCKSPDLERRFEKIAIYVKKGQPSHAARQLPDGQWSSKLGPWECITHGFDALEGNEYGQAECLMSRRRPTWISTIRDRIAGAMSQCWRLIGVKNASHRVVMA